MAITTQQFRYDFPEFNSTTTYPNSQIEFWLNLAYMLINPNRWKRMTDLGAELFVAHHITIEARNQAEANNGGIPGQNTGPVSSKSVDKVSISYSTGDSIDPGAGHWNLTSYGTRFHKLLLLFGAGPIQIGVGITPALNSPAWAGPDVTPGFTNFG